MPVQRLRRPARRRRVLRHELHEEERPARGRRFVRELRRLLLEARNRAPRRGDAGWAGAESAPRSHRGLVPKCPPPKSPSCVASAIALAPPLRLAAAAHLARDCACVRSAVRVRRLVRSHCESRCIAQGRGWSVSLGAGSRAAPQTAAMATASSHASCASAERRWLTSSARSSSPTSERCRSSSLLRRASRADRDDFWHACARLNPRFVARRSLLAARAGRPERPT